MFDSIIEKYMAPYSEMNMDPASTAGESVLPSDSMQMAP